MYLLTLQLQVSLNAIWHLLLLMEFLNKLVATDPFPSKADVILSENIMPCRQNEK